MSGLDFSGYAPPGEERPLGPYAALTGLFNATFISLLARAARDGRLPERVGAGDLVLYGAATQKLSRLLAKDRVTSFLRAPFTEYQEAGAPGEVEEKPRGHGLKLAIGELAVCPYCLAQWVAAGFVAGGLLAPRPTRAIASIFAALSISDFLQLAYKAAEERA